MATGSTMIEMHQTIGGAAIWPRVKIDDLKSNCNAAIAIGPFGSRMKSDCYVAAGVRVIRGNNLSDTRSLNGEFVYVSDDTADRMRNCIVVADDLVFPHRGAIGEVGIVPDDGRRYILSTSLMKVTCDLSKVDPNYLFYFFRSSAGRHELLKNASTVGTPGIGQPLTSLKSIQVPLAPLREQKAIATILGALDDKIELNRRMNETLEAMARAIFKSWFVDFDPVRAKLDGRLPVGMDSATAALFPDSFEDSKLGPIPRSWTIESIYVAADVVYGAPFASALFNVTGLGRPLIRIRDLQDERPGVFTSEVHPKGYLVQPGDVVVGMDGEFRAYLWGGEESWLNQRLCVFAPKHGFSAPFVLNSIVALLADIEATETATTVIHLGKNDIDRFRTVVPNKKVAGAFNSMAVRWFERIVVNKQESRTLAALRDALLPKLLSGEIRVGEAERQVSAVM